MVERSRGVGESVRRYAFGALLLLAALALVLRPGVPGKVVALLVAGAGVMVFVRRDRSGATIVTVLLVAIVVFYVVLAVTGHADWITDRYRR